MKYKANKTFERAGKLYRSGDALPDDLDDATVAHYTRHSMIEAVMDEEDVKRTKSNETKPVKLKQPRQAGPTEKKDLSTDPQGTGADGGQVTIPVTETGNDAAGSGTNQGE